MRGASGRSATRISARELAQVDRANSTTAAPVVFIHGLWLLPSSWDPWAALFEEAGYVVLTPDWPDDPQTVEGARAEPGGPRGKDPLAQTALDFVRRFA